MNNLILSNVLTMSSNEIANLVDSRHDKVKQSIERLAGRGTIQLPPMGEVKNHLGQMVKEYIFTGEQGKRDSIIVVAQLSPEFTARLVDRWQELEAQIAKPIDPIQVLNDPKKMRGLLLTYSEKVIALEERVGELQPKAEALDRIAKVTDGSMCITDAAKHLDIAPKQLFTFLSCKEWIYRRLGNKNWVGYQDKIQQGLLEHKIVVIGSDDDGNDKTAPQVRITRKGLTKLSEMLTVDRAV